MTIHPDDITFCTACAQPYPMQRRALGFTVCTACSDAMAQSAQRHVHRNHNAHTLAEYRNKHTDIHAFIHSGTHKRSM